MWVCTHTPALHTGKGIRNDGPCSASLTAFPSTFSTISLPVESRVDISMHSPDVEVCSSVSPPVQSAVTASLQSFKNRHFVAFAPRPEAPRLWTSISTVSHRVGVFGKFMSDSPDVEFNCNINSGDSDAVTASLGLSQNCHL